MPKYKLCPRCEVNYILDDAEYCEICRLEMAGKLREEEEELEDDGEICPRCRINYLNDGERFCESCVGEIAAEKAKKALDDIEPDEWSKIDEEDEEEEDIIEAEEEEEVPISLEELAENEEWDDAGGFDDAEEPVDEELEDYDYDFDEDGDIEDDEEEEDDEIDD